MLQNSSLPNISPLMLHATELIVASLFSTNDACNRTPCCNFSAHVHMATHATRTLIPNNSHTYTHTRTLTHARTRARTHACARASVGPTTFEGVSFQYSSAETSWCFSGACSAQSAMGVETVGAASLWNVLLACVSALSDNHRPMVPKLVLFGWTFGQLDVCGRVRC
jgi:hypothetical protein